MTPHVSSDDDEAYIPRTLDLFFDNLRRHFAGKPLRNRVRPKLGYREGRLAPVGDVPVSNPAEPMPLTSALLLTMPVLPPAADTLNKPGKVSSRP